MSEMKRLAWLMLLATFFLSAPNLRAAEFTFDFTLNPDFKGALPGGVNGNNATFAGNDRTRFFQAAVNIGGVEYIQTIVGSGGKFGIETYTSSIFTGNVGSTASVRPFSQDTGGNERALIGSQQELSTSQSSLNSLPGHLLGNARDTFGQSVSAASGFQPYDLSGTGTGNPNRIVLRMQLQDEGMIQEVYKPLLTRKPRIEQKVINSTTSYTMASDFVADMRGLTYDKADRAAKLTNRLAIRDLTDDEGTMPTPGAGDFDMTQAQNSVHDAGRYTYTPGTGWNDKVRGWDVNNSTFDEGSYAYVGSTFDVFNVDWGSFFDTRLKLKDGITDAPNAAACKTINRRNSVICSISTFQ